MENCIRKCTGSAPRQPAAVRQTRHRRQHSSAVNTVGKPTRRITYQLMTESWSQYATALHTADTKTVHSRDLVFRGQQGDCGHSQRRRQRQPPRSSVPSITIAPPSKRKQRQRAHRPEVHRCHSIRNIVRLCKFAKVSMANNTAGAGRDRGCQGDNDSDDHPTHHAECADTLREGGGKSGAPRCAVHLEAQLYNDPWPTILVAFFESFPVYSTQR